MPESSGFDGDLNSPRVDQPTTSEDPQREETVKEAYTVAQKWLKTGLPTVRHHRFVQFEEKDGTVVYVGGYIQEHEDSELLARAEDKPLVEITFNPPANSDKGRERYGISVNEETGQIFMERRMNEDEYPREDALAEQNPIVRETKLQEIERRIRQDQQIARGLGDARMSEMQTREVTKRLTSLNRKNRISRKGRGGELL